MFLVRVNFRGGLLHEYNFKDNVALAETQRKLVAAAMMRKETCEFADEIGRTANINGEDVIAVQLVHIGQEVIGNLSMAEYVGMIYKRLGVQAPQASLPAPPMAEAEDAPLPSRRANGGLGGFAG